MTARRYQHTRAKTPDTVRGEDWRESARCVGSQRRTVRKRNRSNGITLPAGPADCTTCGLQFANPGRLAAHSRTHEATCKRGHVIAEVGRAKDRTCRQCRADQQRARNQRKETA